MKTVEFECGVITPMFLVIDANKPVRAPSETGVLLPAITLSLPEKLG